MMKKNLKRLSLAKETLRWISGGVTGIGVSVIVSTKPVEPVKTEPTWACDTVYDCGGTVQRTCV